MQHAWPQPSLYAAGKKAVHDVKAARWLVAACKKTSIIGKFFDAQGGGVYVWLLLHGRLELNAPSSYGLLCIGIDIDTSWRTLFDQYGTCYIGLC